MLLKRLKRTDLLLGLFLTIIASFLVLDLFVNTGQAAAFDGQMHATMIAQFYHGLTNGDFPVQWADGYANYGMPMPLIHQQVTSYLGAFINILVHNVLLSFNLVFLIGAVLSTLFFYIFLRFHFRSLISFAGAFLFCFAPYRIINIYIRADQPEFFASVFIPLVLIGIHLVCKKRFAFGVPIVTVSTALLILTHPFMFLIGCILFVPYAIILLWREKDWMKKTLILLISTGIGVGLTGYYALPLLVETKYFYYGLAKNHFTPGQFLSFKDYFDPRWYYFTKEEILVRGDTLKAGLLESLIVLFGIGVSGYLLFTKKKNTLLMYAVVVSILLIFFTTQFAESLYLYINFLSNIQHPWRMLSGFIFLPGLIQALLLSQFSKYRLHVIFVLLLIVGLFRFPQIYGKNYTLFPENHYFFTVENYPGPFLNTIWTGLTRQYPVHREKVGIISGKGTVLEKNIQNASRTYRVSAQTPLRMVDYTFYFPGWKVWIDGQENVIEFQDPSFRGVITYTVPKGTHSIKLAFTPTKIRVVGRVLTILSVFFLFGWYLLVKKRKLWL